MILSVHKKVTDVLIHWRLWWQCGERWQLSVWWKADDSNFSVRPAQRLPQVSHNRGAPQCPRLHSDGRRGAAGVFYLSFFLFGGSVLPSFDLFSEIFHFQTPRVPCYSWVLISRLPLWPLKTFLSQIHIFWYIILHFRPFPHDCLLCGSGGEGLGCAVWAVEEQPSSRAGAGRAAGVGRGAAVLPAAHAELRRRGQRESLQGEEQLTSAVIYYQNGFNKKT